MCCPASVLALGSAWLSTVTTTPAVTTVRASHDLPGPDSNTATSIHTGWWTMSMSQHPVQPRSAAGTVPLTPFVLLGALWGALVLSWLAWFAGRVCAWVTGHPAGPAFGSRFVTDVVTGRWDVA